MAASIHTALLLPEPPLPELYTLSLHDALPISGGQHRRPGIDLPVRVQSLSARIRKAAVTAAPGMVADQDVQRSEEHTSELQSRGHLVCRLLLEKKKQ